MVGEKPIRRKLPSLGNFKLGGNRNPNSISNITALNIEDMTFESALPSHVTKPDFKKNREFNTKLLRHTLQKVYGVESVHDIEYKKKLNRMMIAIGTHRVHVASYNGIKFVEPETAKEINCFDFAVKFVETPDREFKDMSPEEQ